MKRAQVYFPQDLYTKIRSTAQKRGVSIAEIVRTGVAKEVQNKKPASGAAQRLLKAAINVEKIVRQKGLLGPPDISRRHNDYLVEDQPLYPKPTYLKR